MTRRSWFRFALQTRGSVIPAIWPRTLVCGVLAELIAVMFALGLPVHMPGLVTIIPNVVLGLILVFRTNTAYERYWEGRKLWGHLVNTARSLARQIWVTVQEQEPGDRPTKIALLHLIVAFAIATKVGLRQEPINPDELTPLLLAEQLDELTQTNHPALKIAVWLGDGLQRGLQRHQIHPYQAQAMQTLINDLTDALGGCERILKTPIPMAYAIHLKQLLLIYCLTLPFQVVQDLGFWTGPVVTLVSFTLFGIEEIGIEIENPFGRDPNDLPLDAICQTMLVNIEDLIAMTPTCDRTA
ncbi:MAG: hypothetical protein KME20_15860 [Kaiparowitsia implicata GSE-PSE-MK54-09C]|nr:hypothetical protein [Kaiparowitsia implicata GSE-PSE-MK54-09C]